MSNKLYDKLKFIAQILLPALATLYITIAQFVSVPNPEAVAGIIIAIDTFLGTLLGISSANYKKGN